MRHCSQNLWLHTYAVLVAGATFLLILAGALVTSNDAGLAVPDWPLSYGGLRRPWSEESSTSTATGWWPPP